METDKHVTIKIWTKTRHLARIVAAHTGEKLLELFARLVTEEARRVGVDVEAIAKRDDDNATR